MEPAKIDWDTVESVFVEDKLYENITAPKWVDFLVPDEDNAVDDVSWFCRPDCNHPKTAEDFLRTPPTSKHSISGDRNKSPLGSWNLRDAKLKRRGGQNHPPPNSSEDCENQNPNFSTPPIHHAKSMKEMIKSSTEIKKPAEDGAPRKNEGARLKATLSARNLFAGRDILTHITDFCNELKKMTLRAREREAEEDLKEDQTAERNYEVAEAIKEVDAREKEMRPLLETSACVKEKPKRIRIVQELENTPPPLNLANVKSKEDEQLLQIRTNPPSPQCFSAARAPIKTTHPKDSKSRFMERGILQELKQHKEELKQKKEIMKEEAEEKGKRSLLVAEGKEARGLDVFWFLKPCTLSSQ